MKVKTVPTDRALYIAVGLSSKECQDLLDSKPLNGKVLQDKSIRLWCATKTVRANQNVGMAVGADYTIMLLPRQVRDIARYNRMVDFRQEANGHVFRFLFYGTKHCKADDVLAIPLAMDATS